MAESTTTTTPDFPPAAAAAVRTIDASKLPSTTFDSRSPVWWGNALLLLIETTTIALLLASYLYLWRNFEDWPPPRVTRQPALYDTNPDLGAATVNTLLLLGSCVPMYLTSQAARRQEARKVRVGLAVMLGLSLASLALTWFEFPALKLRWDENAYGSIVWTTVGMCFLYVLVGVGEFLIMGLWVWLRELDDSHALDVTLAAGYWYWVAGTGAVVYATLFLAPRLV